MADFKWVADQKLDPEEVLRFVDQLGAPTIHEVKNHFKTNSRAVRRVLGVLLYKDKVVISSYRGGIAIHRATGEKGRPDIEKLRRRVGVVGSTAAPGRKKKAAQLPETSTAKMQPVYGRQDEEDPEDVVPFRP